MKHHIGYANRGKGLESYIINANASYEVRNIAIIKKVPTPIQVERLGPGGKIAKARFERGELVDFIGVYGGKGVAFDAKSTREERFPLKDLKEHQFKLLEQYYEQDAYSFLIVEFAMKQEIYLLRFDYLKAWWFDQYRGGRKSIPYSFFQEKCKLVRSGRGIAVDYLAAL